MDKSDHHDHYCGKCEVELEIDGRRLKHAKGTVSLNPIYCPYCGKRLMKKKEIVLTGGPMTLEEVSKSMDKSWKEAVAKEAAAVITRAKKKRHRKSGR